MNIRSLSLLALAASALSCPAFAQMPPPSMHPAAAPAEVAQWVTPAIQQWRGRGGTFALSAHSRVVVTRQAMEADARRFADDLARLGGPRLSVVTARTGRPGDIVFRQGAVAAGKPGDEAYSLDISSGVTASAPGRAGLIHAQQSLLQLLKHDRQRLRLPRGQAIDWPNYPLRVMMVDVGRKFYQVDQLDALMRQMAWLKMNALHLHFTDWSAFRLNSPKYPGLAAEQSYDRSDIAHLEATAARYGITLIPEIDMPAHAVALTRYRPALAFDCEAMRRSDWLDRSAGPDAAGKAWAVDITKETNRQWLDGLLDEFIPWFDGPYFHIGGDEYQYDKDKTRCPELMDAAKAKGLQYPGDVFVDFINATDKVVRAHGKTMIVWNWWRFKDDQTSIEPNRDIVIDAWNTPRMKDIINKGYPVIVSPEDKLYVVPGIENFDGNGYGVVDGQAVYDTLPLEGAPNVLGYSLDLWADAAEGRTDTYMLGKAYEPMAVVAERTWSNHPSPYPVFLRRLNDAGSAPR